MGGIRPMRDRGRSACGRDGCRRRGRAMREVVGCEMLEVVVLAVGVVDGAGAVGVGEGGDKGTGLVEAE
ncbi:hypothetical protein BOVATA_007020 [Babesia ovata]|uniref:Uncharacterized protein n=1 Tax=Babesia ovata TaxID=189622 RepID=A0A2H6K8D2_9APIC|nr:uncharacterized protein BOVATA_007020 [Babesia ovata]GBE59209.1 hypothetical protein BOVATA_007020 [Babesia ovata]